MANIDNASSHYTWQQMIRVIIKLCIVNFVAFKESMTVNGL